MQGPQIDPVKTAVDGAIAGGLVLTSLAVWLQILGDLLGVIPPPWVS